MLRRGVDDRDAASLSFTFCAITRDAAAARAMARNFAGDGRRTGSALMVGVPADLPFAGADLIGATLASAPNTKPFF